MCHLLQQHLLKTANLQLLPVTISLCICQQAYNIPQLDTLSHENLYRNQIIDILSLLKTALLQHLLLTTA